MNKNSLNDPKKTLMFFTLSIQNDKLGLMNSKLKKEIIKSGLKTDKNEKQPKIIKEFSLKTGKKNQLLAFFKPENFLEKTEEQIGKILDLALEKFKEYGVKIDGAAIFPGPALEKYSIMDRHYGVINSLSKGASSTISKADMDLIFSSLGIEDKSLKVLGGHEAMSYSGIKNPSEFDGMWVKNPSKKIRSGFYVSPMILKNETVIVVNGFHPQQLAYYTASDRKLAVLLVSSNTSWKSLREEMLGDSFPEKANTKSIRGIIYNKAKDFGFEIVRIDNNIMHLSAGPTEALFEMNNFLKDSLGIDIVESDAKLASKLRKSGMTNTQIKEILTNQEIHSELEHKDTKEAVKIIKKKLKPKAS